MQTTPELFHESLDHAVREVAQYVTATEGNKQSRGLKVLAAALWPTKSTDEAHRHLLDCLNDDRPHKLAPAELFAIGRIGRDVGCPAVANYVAREMGYNDPTPKDPKREVDDLRARIADGLDFIRANAEKLDRLTKAAA